jgi:hypothetical protein
LGEEADFTKLFQIAAEMTPEQLHRIREKMGSNSVRWLAQLPALAETTCGQDMFAVAGLTADKIASVRQPVVALYDGESPFMATCNWLKENLTNIKIEIVPGARHLAPVQNAPVFVHLVNLYVTELAKAHGLPSVDL